MRTRTKTFMFTSVVIAIVITFSFGLLYYFLPIVYENDKKAKALVAAEEVIEKIKNQPVDRIKEIISNEEITQGVTTWSIKNSKDQVIYPVFTTVENRKTTDYKNAQFVVAKATSILPLVTTIINDSEGKKYTVEVSMFSEPIKEVKETLLKIYPFILGLSFLVGGIGAYIYSYWATKRVRRISNRTKNMVVLEESADYVVKGKDEISELESNIQFLYHSLLKNIQSLNLELEKSNAVELSKSEFMRIASHELKTPITAMLGIIEGMILNVGRFKDRDHYLNVCKEILESQSQLVQDVLFISKLESIEKFETSKELFSITELLNETFGLFELMSVQKKLVFEVKLSEIMVESNREDMKRIITNILSNAVKYTKKQGIVSIVLTSDSLMVGNQCTPMEKEEIDKICLPFYRPDYARARKDGGTGLGLYIVSQLALKNELTFIFEPMENKTGMIFTLSLTSIVRVTR
ncbi:sensor histidine kinase [Enterococcus rotai]|uniref:sensor histidine kinase n=1 Tax=Enterococcus rotai TaxID=118060 RepID=UPI0032B50B96